MDLFKAEVFDKVKVAVVAALVGALNRERDGGPAGDRNLLRNVVIVRPRGRGAAARSCLGALVVSCRGMGGSVRA
jgi:hypothetical protein